MSERIHTDKAPKAIGPYSQAVKGSGELLFLSGQIPIVPETGEVLSGSIEDQTTQVLKNLAAVLEAGGSSLERVLKTTVFLANMDDFPQMNAVYAQFFAHEPPARSTVEVSRLPRNVKIEIDLIASVE